MPDRKRYFMRRFLRVFPAYYAQLLIILLAGAWFVTWRPLEGSSLLAHLVMFFNMGTEPVRPMVGLWWTLPVELSFYLLLPLLALVMKPGRWVFVLVAGCVLSVFYRMWAAGGYGEIPGEVVFLNASQLPGSLPEFLLGASAAILVSRFNTMNIKQPSKQMADIIMVGGIVLTTLWLSQVVFRFAGLYWQGHWSMIIAPIALGFALSLIVLGLYWQSPIGKALFANRVVYFIGLISYSLYLWHFVVIQQLQSLGGEAYAALPGVLKFIICTTLVTALSAASYFLVERPFFRLRGQRKSVTPDTLG
jgi:peptidoglycan/LPS O-acetylase OafA/YrhL